MDRPPNLREDLFQEINLTACAESAAELGRSLQRYGYDVQSTASMEVLLATVVASPGPYLLHRCDIFNRADLLRGLMLEFDDGEPDAGLVYLIDRHAAEQIATGEKTVVLRIAGGGAVSVQRSRLERAFASGCVVDFTEAGASRQKSD